KLPFPAPYNLVHFLYCINNKKKRTINTTEENEIPPFLEQICTLIASKDETNQTLAKQLAMAQGWKEEDWEIYFWFYKQQRS
ncbi:MAG: hypothetical protein EAZ55_11150, partial [Cytophagales bacterium]